MVRAFAEELRDGGVRLVQYRDKRNGPQEMLRAAGEIADVFRGLEVKLLLNDRADLASLLKWGVHVGQGDLPVEAARRVLGIAASQTFASHPSRKEERDEWGTRSGGTMIGVSTHNEEQVRAADANEPDYVAIGPVFATSSKQNPDPVIGLEGVRRARTLTPRPLVAIGGITRENAQAVIEAGADSVAVIGGLLAKDERTEEIIRGFREKLA